MGARVFEKPLKLSEQYTAVNDEKLRMTLIGMADTLSERVREHIYRTYQDDRLNLIYMRKRQNVALQKGNWNKAKGGATAYRRKILEFPSAYVYDFCNTVLSAIYGPGWLENNKALNHELVKQWWVVDKL